MSQDFPAPDPRPAPPPSTRRPPGRRTIRVGIAVMVLATLVIGAAGAFWLFFGKAGGSEAEVFDMPGSVSKDLTTGEWALRSEEFGGAGRTPRRAARRSSHPDQGPGPP